MKIIVMRHGETCWNVIGRSQGRSANRLNQNGKEQVRASAEKLKGRGIDLIISSPLMRTMQTSNLVSKALGVKVMKDERIIEFDQGEYTGKLRSTFTPADIELRLSRTGEKGIETYKSIETRVKSFLSDLKKSYSGKTPLIITHDGIAWCIELLLQGKSFTRKSAESVTKLKNAEFREFELN